VFVPPDCQACGACCHAAHDRHAPVLGADHARLGSDAERLTVWLGNRCYMRMADGHCVALIIDQGRYACSVYERRPQVCRDLERGGPACQHEVESRPGA
jgi:uncharacterized protein